MGLYFEDVEVGYEMTELSKGPIQKVQHVMYAGASGDFNPLHTDDEFARAVGMEGVICHGMLIMGFVGQAVTSWVPKKDLRRFGVRFAGMTTPGSTITVTGKVVDKRKDGDENRISCEVEARDEKGDVKITGRFEAVLPSKNQ
ncbi:MAG: MaoC/PaaZ C-terminal domain-containing protein [Thermodesulfobacteriota bacterium]|nr:MaoC/PaaZ C-terminal domain-containing protein [Thermodesulfobacteriota bacterium]